MARAVDTLELFDELKHTFTEEQAHTLSRTLKRVEEARLDELATKADIRELKGDIKEFRGDLKELEARLKTEIIKWVAGLLVVQSGIVIGAVFAMFRLVTAP